MGGENAEAVNHPIAEITQIPYIQVRPDMWEAHSPKIVLVTDTLQ